jgi:hypothetical protein
MRRAVDRAGGLPEALAGTGIKFDTESRDGHENDSSKWTAGAGWTTPAIKVSAG